MGFLKSLVRIVAVGTPLIWKSFSAAYGQAAARAVPIAAANGGMMGKMGAERITPMTKDEAVKILNVEDRVDEKDFDFEEAQSHFERMFTQNAPEKGGSFYIQSKIYFARALLEQELVKSGTLSPDKAAEFRRATEQIVAKKDNTTEKQES